jgi:hypothetical protein
MIVVWYGGEREATSARSGSLAVDDGGRLRVTRAEREVDGLLVGLMV